jgi:hypothetical protein
VSNKTGQWPKTPGSCFFKIDEDGGLCPKFPGWTEVDCTMATGEISLVLFTETDNADIAT